MCYNVSILFLYMQTCYETQNLSQLNTLKPQTGCAGKGDGDQDPALCQTDQVKAAKNIVYLTVC